MRVLEKRMRVLALLGTAAIWLVLSAVLLEVAGGRRLGTVGLIIVSLALLASAVPAWCFLARRLGYEWTAGLLMLFPVLNLFVLLSWAFWESPHERELRVLRARNESRDQPFPQHQAIADE